MTKKNEFVNLSKQKNLSTKNFRISIENRILIL